MFLSKMMRRSREPSEQKGETNENGKPGKGNNEADDSLVTQISNLEELVTERTKNLENAKEELSQLVNASESSGEDKKEAEAQEEAARPHRPRGELVVEPEGEVVIEEENLEISVEKADEQGEKQEQGGEQEKESGQEMEGGDDSLSNLFNQDEEEVNPLAGLISSLPEITAEELLNEARAIEATLSEEQQDK